MTNDKKIQSPLQTAEAKQGAITTANLRSPKRIRIAGFRGRFMDAYFDDEGVSDGPVKSETLDALKKQFPQITIENA